MWARATLLALLIGALSPGAALAHPGDLDPSFGTGGKADPRINFINGGDSSSQTFFSSGFARTASNDSAWTRLATLLVSPCRTSSSRRGLFS